MRGARPKVDRRADHIVCMTERDDDGRVPSDLMQIVETFVRVGSLLGSRGVSFPARERTGMRG